MGHELNLKKPKTFNEKLQWLKLNDKSTLHGICADKYLVREFVEREIGEEFLVPLYFVTDDTTELTFENIGSFDSDVIIKSNHDSSGGVVIKKGNFINYNRLRNFFRYILRTNFFLKTREYQYKEIKPLILIEKLLKDNEAKPLKDYKIHCFEGKAKFIYVSEKNYLGVNRRAFYDTEWNELPFMWAHKKSNHDDIRMKVSKPNNLQEMIRLAECLANYFLYVRIDFYNIKGKIYFGEITFHQGSGFEKIEPFEYKLEGFIK